MVIRLSEHSEAKDVNRRDFMRDSMRTVVAICVGGLGGLAANRSSSAEMVWQIDPHKCVQCGRCALNCVLNQSAVKCVHAFDVCGYCDLCGGYLQPSAKQRDTAAENQLCPTNALKRKFIEDPYFEYTIEESLCIGCGKCVEGCAAFGNGSLHLQVRHDLCLNCNECSIALACPAEAFSRVPASRPYLMKGKQGDV